jgi:DNA-binding CsgD family transcriptional regulator
VALHRGEVPAAREHASAAEAAWAAHSTPLGVDFMALAVAGVAEAADDRDQAFEVLDGAWEAFGAIGVRSCQPLLGADLVRLALATGRTSRGEAVAAELTEVAAGSGLEGHRALAAHTVGLVDGDVALLREAVTRHDATGRRLEAAVCLADAARVAHRQNHRDADELQRRAVGRLEAIGAAGTIERLRRDLGGGAPASVDRFGWDSLTPTELAIVELVVAGLTNAQIASERGVSRRTVESHLVRVYTKIGISSRVQLAVAAAERGIA